MFKDRGEGLKIVWLKLKQPAVMAHKNTLWVIVQLCDTHVVTYLSERTVSGTSVPSLLSTEKAE